MLALQLVVLPSIVSWLQLEPPGTRRPCVFFELHIHFWDKSDREAFDILLPVFDNWKYLYVCVRRRAEKKKGTCARGWCAQGPSLTAH